tara:strand:+ start:622 stop:1113 length:492 start_codon:yes stop_codon:yes gene_type:complete
MTVPASGELSLQGLYNEVDDSTYPGSGSNTDVSLKNISTGGNPPGVAINTASSSRPDGTAPHAMSEFYGYDQGAAAAGYTLYYFSGKASDCTSVCGTTNTATVYSSTASSAQDIFDNQRAIYSNSAETVYAPTGWYAEGTSTGDACGRWSNTGSWTSIATCGQ